MPTRSFIQTRRSFLKGAAYTSALAVVGVAGSSSLALAGDRLVQQQSSDTEIIDLINHTASPIKFDKQGLVSIAPGGQLSVVVPVLSSASNGSANNKNLIITDVLANDQLAIRSDYPEFNGIYPMTEFAKQAA